LSDFAVKERDFTTGTPEETRLPRLVASDAKR
jgi:hypothetical protein